MTLPPIRYPLPSLIALVVASLLAWQGVEWSRQWRLEMAARARRALEGPPVPSSPRPRVVAGPIVARALLLRDETPAASRPGGPTVETIDRRMFVNVYDTWPEPGPATSYRIGNRKPVGWVRAADVLPWETRLVIRAPAGLLTPSAKPGAGPPSPIRAGTIPLPVLAWTDHAVEVAVWEPDRPWSAVDRRIWVASDDLPSSAWGVWISQFELPALFRLAIDGDPAIVRLRAVIGRLADPKPLTRADLEAARPALPALVFARPTDPRRSAGRLAEANNRPESDAAWSGLNFRFLPLDDLP